MSSKAKVFLEVIRNSKKEGRKIILNKKKFNFNDLKRWRFYLTIFIEYFWAVCNVLGKDFNEQMRMVLKEADAGKKRARAIIGINLGNWEDY